MAVMRSAAIDHAPSRVERRNFQRVRVKIYGRFMLEDRTEHACQVTDMSPGNVALRADRIGEPGEKVIAYIDHIGRVEGVVTRTLDDGFAMTVIASERKKDKLAAQLTWLANKHELDLPEDRRHERVAPRNPMSVLKLTDGRQYQCRIVDLSLSGATLLFQMSSATPGFDYELKLDYSLNSGSGSGDYSFLIPSDQFASYTNIILFSQFGQPNGANSSNDTRR
jgi:c-di-GMP-binding flagellar brake protein YcgR